MRKAQSPAAGIPVEYVVAAYRADHSSSGAHESPQPSTAIPSGENP